MNNLSLLEVRPLVAAANAVRRQRAASGSAVGSDGRRAERHLDVLFRISHTLAVYGTPPRADIDATGRLAPPLPIAEGRAVLPTRVCKTRSQVKLAALLGGGS